MILTCWNLSDQVRFMIRPDKTTMWLIIYYMVYVEIEIELSQPFELSTVCYENQIRQGHDWSYRCGLHQKRNYVIINYSSGCNLWWKSHRTTTWSIVYVWYMLKMTLSIHDQSDRVQSVMKTRHDNDVIDCIGQVYAKTKIRLLGPIWLGTVCDES